MKVNDIGVDLSQHNSYVDFNKLKNDGVKFVILRLGWIGNKKNHTLDTYFFDYYKRAKQVGLSIGIYIYNYCRSVQAIDNGCQWIEKQISGINFDLAIFIDQEDKSIIDCGKENLTLQSEYFCNYFEKRGFKTGIYANKNWFTNYLDYNRLKSHWIWLAEWNKNITFKDRVDIWQYTSNGHFEGITGRVDTNKIITVKNVEKPDENSEKNVESELYVEMKEYKNGSTIEKVYSDTSLCRMVGYLNKNETCQCLGKTKNLAIVQYKIDGTDDYKIGYVQWLGGIK